MRSTIGQSESGLLIPKNFRPTAPSHDQLTSDPSLSKNASKLHALLCLIAVNLFGRMVLHLFM